jgi:hypothetical protein
MFMCINTAVCCQPLILCCMRDFVTIIFILYRCVMSIFDCILCLWVYHEHIYILYSCVLSTFDCMLYVCCCMFICIQYNCMLSTFDCMLYVCCCMFICIQYNCVLSTCVCVFLLICNLCNEFYVYDAHYYSLLHITSIKSFT